MITRLFGKCITRGCTARAILDTDGTIRTQGPVVVNEAIGYAACTEHRADAVCGGGPFPLKWSKVKATHNDHECDPACRVSANPICKCSCGGANHGSRFAIITSN